MLLEVADMEFEGFWQVFADTGDPICWLMYSAKKRSGVEIEESLKAFDTEDNQSIAPPKME